MKTIDNIIEDIKTYQRLITETVDLKIINNYKTKINDLINIKIYVESNPRIEFINSEINRLKKLIEGIEYNVNKILNDSSLNKNKKNKLKKELLKVYPLAVYKKQLLNLEYIIK